MFYHPVHQTRDGYVTANIGTDFRAWQNTCKAIGRPELLADPRFSSNALVIEHRDEATALVQAWLATQTSEEAERVLTAHHVVCGVVKTVPEAVRQPQIRARGLVAEVDDPVLGRIEVINSAVKFLESEVGVKSHAPTLGEHNESILRDLLALDAQSIAQLRAQGVLRDAKI